ncbi:glycosyltransferase [Pengzhenrongella frigida]|uniref:glycosyltransferase n=1 Tax=Pengzhenrongella frigida TaxID=1259133 RepID=UPI0013EA96D5|nr:glycosyltransferase family 2 protein [Cellulomonas sp. HLT2-17]
MTPGGQPPSVTVVISTHARPQHLGPCLDHVSRLHTPPAQVIVVDSSPDDRTAGLVDDHFPTVTYLRSDVGPGTGARQIGFAAAVGDVVAFLDDDALVDPAWLDELVAPYDDPAVVGVGGRVDHDLAGERSAGLGQIGRLLPNGHLTGNFGADPGRAVVVDHLSSASMSFRRSDLRSIGGLLGNAPWSGSCEGADLSLRLRAAGGRLVFTPHAVVAQPAPPSRAGNERFDHRRCYRARRDHVVALVRAFGPRAPVVRRIVVTTVRDDLDLVLAVVRTLVGRPSSPGVSPTVHQRLRAPATLVRIGPETAGLVAGLISGLVAAVRRSPSEVRTPTAPPPRPRVDAAAPRRG